MRLLTGKLKARFSKELFLRKAAQLYFLSAEHCTTVTKNKESCWKLNSVENPLFPFVRQLNFVHHTIKLGLNTLFFDQLQIRHRVFSI